MASGHDHPGILDELTHYVLDRQGRIEGVRVANLRGYSSMLMLVGGDAGLFNRLERDLPGLRERSGCSIRLERPAEEADDRPAAERYFITVVGRGEGEVLRQAGNLLRVLNVNIEDVSTKLVNAGTIGGSHFYAGQPDEPFEMRLAVMVPSDVPLGKLRELLGQLFGALDVSWEIRGPREE